MTTTAPLSNQGDDFLLLILSSASGAGKTTLCKRLRAELPDLRFSVSHTTRSPRPSETDGKDYHFIDTDAFERMIGDGAFAEWARVHGNLYGTSLREIEIARASSSGLLFDIDHQGARKLKAHFPGAASVFILPPSFAELERRLRGRGTEDEVALRKRLFNARHEIERYSMFDYVVINDDLEQAFAELSGIVRAERCKRSRRSLICERMLEEQSVERNA